MTESEFLYTVLYYHASFPGMKNCCEVLYHNYVHPASIYRILPQIRPDTDLSWIHQIHRISGQTVPKCKAYLFN